MNARELLQQRPGTKLVDKYSGVTFTVAELSPIVVRMLEESEVEATVFCERFVIDPPKETP